MTVTADEAAEPRGHRRRVLGDGLGPFELVGETAEGGVDAVRVAVGGRGGAEAEGLGEEAGARVLLLLLGEGAELEEHEVDHLGDLLGAVDGAGAPAAHGGLDQLGDVVVGDGEAEAEEEAGQIAAQIVGGLVALVGVAGEGALDDGVELGGHVAVDLGERGDDGVADHAHRLEVGLALEEAAAGEHLPEDDAHAGEDVVDPLVDRLLHHRLGRQVAELALDDAGVAGGELARGLGEAEVHDLHLAVAGDEHVGGGDVAVDDVEGLAVDLELVGVGEALADAGGDVDRGLDRRGAADLLGVVHHRLEVGAVDVLHHDEVGAVADPDVEADDVGVREVRQGGLVEFRQR